MKKILFTLLNLILLNGCATYYEQSAQTDCVTTHWYEAGFDAAKVGQYKAQSWANLDDSCGQYNLWSDKESFNKGYSLGLRQFCTRNNGFEFGHRNLSYNAICPSDFQNPTLLFWDGQKQLNSIELSEEIAQPPLVELARFIIS